MKTTGVRGRIGHDRSSRSDGVRRINRRLEEVASLLAFCGKENLGEFGSGILPIPIALQFANDLNPAHRLPAGLGDALQASFVRRDRRASDRVDDRIDLVAGAQRVEAGKCQAHLGPKGRHDELFRLVASTAARKSGSSQALRVVRSIGRMSGNSRWIWEMVG